MPALRPCPDSTWPIAARTVHDSPRQVRAAATYLSQNAGYPTAWHLERLVAENPDDATRASLVSAYMLLGQYEAASRLLTKLADGPGGGMDGDFVALDAETGKESWSNNLQKNYGGRVMSGWNWSESVEVQ